MPRPGARKNEHALSTRDLDILKRLLVERRTHLRGTVQTLGDKTIGKNPSTEAGDVSSIPVHMADVGSDVFEHDLNLGLVEKESAELAAIEEALRRIESGTFGRCDRCQRPIGRERLMAMPHARLCIDCKRKEEDQAA
jgi:RNA polymerase-binding protein DksA